MVEVKFGRLSEELWGFIDKKGNLVIQPQFDYVEDFSNGLAAVKGGINGKWGYIDKIGNFVIQPQYSNANSFSEGMAVVDNDRCIDKNGNFLSFYSSGGVNFSEGLALVRNKDWKYGYIDKTGRWIIQPQYKEAGIFSEGLAAVPEGEKYGKYGYIDKMGRWVIQPQYGNADKFSEGLAAVKEYINEYINQDGARYGYIDKTGRWVIQPTFFLAHSFSGGKAAVSSGRFQGSSYIDKTGKRMIPPKYNGREVEFLQYTFSEGSIVVSIDQGEYASTLYSYLNKEGDFIVKPRAGEKPRGFSEGLSAFAGGYIDKTGRWIIQPDFDWANNFSDGLALVVIDGKSGYIRNPLQQQQVDPFSSLFR